MPLLLISSSAPLPSPLFSVALRRSLLFMTWLLQWESLWLCMCLSILKICATHLRFRWLQLHNFISIYKMFYHLDANQHNWNHLWSLGNSNRTCASHSGTRGVTCHSNLADNKQSIYATMPNKITAKWQTKARKQKAFDASEKRHFSFTTIWIVLRAGNSLLTGHDSRISASPCTCTFPCVCVCRMALCLANYVLVLEPSPCAWPLPPSSP